MGLLGEDIDPKTQGLLALGFGLLNSRGNLGQAIGQAGPQALQAVAQARAAQQKEAFQNMQMEEFKQQAELRRQQALKLQQSQALAARLMAPQTAPQPTGLPSMMAGSGARTPDQNAQLQQGIQQATQPKSMLSQLNEDQIAGLVASGALPKEAIEIWKLAKFGQQVQPGYNVSVDGKREYFGDPTKGITLNNGQVQVMPGAAQAQGQLVVANKLPEALINAGTKREDFTNPDGTTQSMSGLQFLNNSGGIEALTRQISGQPQQPTAQTAPQPKPQAAPTQERLPMRVPSAIQQARDADRMTILKAELANAKTPEDVAALQREIAKAGGGVTSGIPTQTKIGTEAQGQINTTFLKSSFEPAVQAGNSARDVMASVKTARFALEGLGDTGFGTGAKQSAARVLGALGVPNAEQYAANGAIFAQAAGSRLFTVLGDQKGPQTEGDASRAQKLFASIDVPKQANKFILDLAEAKAAWDQKRASYYQDALPYAREKGDLQEIDRRWQRVAPSVFDLPSMQKWKARLQ